MAQQKIVIEVGDRGVAHTLAGLMQDVMEPVPAALTLFEQPKAGGEASGWRIEAYYEEPQDAAALSAALAEISGQQAPDVRTEDVPDLNWVALSQAALPPVIAGRFTVHGSHDRGRVARGPNSILIDAGEAFGTAHHATTYGCLGAIDRLTRRRQYKNVLDLGCGSGVLAIAVARTQPAARIIATDLDRQSVRVAASNMRDNGVGARITALCAAGLDAPELRRRAPFDLLIANILAGPLIHLSGSISRAVAPGGDLVLSGLLIPQAPSVIASYLSKGFQLTSHERITGWSTLVLKRRD